MLTRGQTLFEPGEDVVTAYFPVPGTIASFVLSLPEGVAAETAMIGQEGALAVLSVPAGSQPSPVPWCKSAAGP